MRCCIRPPILTNYAQDTLPLQPDPELANANEAPPGTPAAPSQPAAAPGEPQHPMPTQSAESSSVAMEQLYSPAPATTTTSALVVRRFREPAGLARYGQLIPYAAQQEAVRESGELWYPARSECEWGYLKILFRSGLSQVWINEILNLKMVRDQSN